MWDIKSSFKFGAGLLLVFISILALFYPAMGETNSVLSGNHATISVSAYENNGFDQYRDIAIGGSGSFNFHPITSLPVTAGVSFDGYFPRFFDQSSRSVNNYEFIFGVPIKWLAWKQFQQEGLFVVATPQLFYQDLTESRENNNVYYGGSLSVQYQRVISDKFSFLIEGGVRGYDAEGTVRTGLFFGTGLALK